MTSRSFTTPYWPAKSPDLNIIEHEWDQPEKAVRARRPRPMTLDELTEAVQQ